MMHYGTPNRSLCGRLKPNTPGSGTHLVEDVECWTCVDLVLKDYRQAERAGNRFMTERIASARQHLNSLPHRAGELAYLDTFSGLVPCRVTAVRESDSGRVILDVGRIVVDVKVTATRGAYVRGEVLTDNRPENVVPRSSVFTRSHVRRIRDNYRWGVS